MSDTLENVYGKVWPYGNRFKWAIFEANGAPHLVFWEAHQVGHGGTSRTQKRAEKRVRKEVDSINSWREDHRLAAAAFVAAEKIT